MRWSPPPSNPSVDYPVPPALLAMKRGALGRCPVCGEGKLFHRYLKVVPNCSQCGVALGHLRADDAPPYFTILLTGHILVPGVLWVEKVYEPPMWLHMAVWLPLFTLICLALLPPIKGAVVGWMIRLGVTGTETGPEAAAGAPRRPEPHASTPHA